IDDFVQKQSTELSQMMARKTARYMEAAWKVLNGHESCAASARESNLDAEILERWVQYLKDRNKDHPYLKPWYKLTSRKENPAEAEISEQAEKFQALAVSFFEERKAIEDRNYVKLGGAKGAKDERTRQYTNLESLPIEKYYLWRDLASDPFMRNGVLFPGGVYYYGIPSSLKRDFDNRGGDAPPVKDIDGWLGSAWKEHLDSIRAELAVLKKGLPKQYAFLHGFKDSAKPANTRIAIRGDQENLGEEAPRRFLQILSPGEPTAFTKGSGRLELADAIAASGNPLMA